MAVSPAGMAISKAVGDGSREAARRTTEATSTAARGAWRDSRPALEKLQQLIHQARHFLHLIVQNRHMGPQRFAGLLFQNSQGKLNA